MWQAGVGVSAQEAERVPADGGSLTQGPAIVLRLLLHTPALQECVYITHQALSTDLCLDQTHHTDHTVLKTYSLKWF